MGLHYKTREMSVPQGKAWVYLCCHPEEIHTGLEQVGRELLELQDCAIWYHDALPPDEEGWDMLGRMKLFVLCVTEKLLADPTPAMEELFPFALKKPIPVLPIMREKEPGRIWKLTDGFNRCCDRLGCGQLQVLNAGAVDPTAIPYAQKLEKFLTGVLLGNEKTEKVRKEFDARIFLSYRKKDRGEALKLLRNIHENEDCQSIAVWYDEFLPLGEKFDDHIRSEIEACDLFTLAVTPNLLEKPNYVMGEEYPFAREKAKKPILAAELVPTDPEALRRDYLEIPDRVDALDPAALRSALRESLKQPLEKREAMRKQGTGAARHDYFMGLAYLHGIDAEQAPLRAESLFERAAGAGVLEAWDERIRMYYYGIGVKKDHDRALALHWESIERHKRACQDRPDDPELNRRLLERLCALLSHLKEMAKPLKGAYTAWDEACRGVIARWPEEYWTLEEYLRCLKSMGEDLIAEDAKLAESACREGLRLGQKWEKTNGDWFFVNLFSEILSNITGDSKYLIDILKPTEERLQRDPENKGLQSELMSVYYRLGSGESMKSHRAEVEYGIALLERALEMAEERLENGSGEDWPFYCSSAREICWSLFDSFLRLALVGQREEDGRRAEEYGKRCVELGGRLAEVTKDVEDRLAWARMYVMIGIYTDMKEGELLYWQMGLLMNRRIAEETKLPMAYDEWALHLHTVGRECERPDLTKKAEQIEEMLAKKYPEYVSGRRKWKKLKTMWGTKRKKAASGKKRKKR